MQPQDIRRQSAHVRAAKCGSLIMGERVLRYDPHQVGRCLDELCECTLVLEGGTVHEARDVVANLGRGDVLSDLDHMSREIAAKDASWCTDKVDICKEGRAAVRVWKLWRCVR